MRLDKFLASCGEYSRKDVKALLKGKRVTVDGAVFTDPGTHIEPEKNIIKLDGEKLEYKPFVYFMMNKPAGCITATEDSRERTVMEYVPEEFMHFSPFPVGRLDKDTEGLLIFTNDGQLAHKLLSPKKKVPKIYHALVEKTVTEKDIKAFREGIYIDEDGYTTLPGDLRVIEKGENPLCEVTVYEGKFHQVKRMFEKCGNRVLYLNRRKFAGIEIDEALPLGGVRELTSDEEAVLRSGDLSE